MLKHSKQLILIIATLLLSSCSKPPNDTLVFSVKTAPRTIDPRFATDAISFRITQLLYIAPIRFNEKTEPQPWLTQWQQTSSRTFTLSINPSATFSDGSPITAEDIIATYQAVLDETIASPHRGSLTNIQSFTALSPQQLQITLKKPDVLFINNLVIGIIPKQFAKQKKLTHQITSGGFTLKNWDGESDITIQRRSDQQIIRFRISKDPTIQTLQLLNDEIDIIQGGLSPELLKYLSEKPQFTIKTHLGSGFTYLGLNLQEKPTNNPKIRQALAYGINRQQIIQYLFNERARPANMLLPNTHWSTHKNLKIYPHNPQKAIALLQQLGYNKNNPLRLSYKTSKNAFRLRVATLLQAQLEAVNIHLDIQSYDWGTFYGDIKKGNFQLYSLSWIGIKSPDIYRYVFHSTKIPPNGANRGRYTNPEVDKWIDLADNAQDFEDKKRYYGNMQKIIAEQLPYVPLWYEDQYAVVSERAKHYKIASDGNFLNLLHIPKLSSKKTKRNK